VFEIRRTLVGVVTASAGAGALDGLVVPGRAFGCRTAWVGPAAWRKRFAEEVRPWSPDVVASDLLAAARAIVKRDVQEDPRGSHDKVIA